MYCLFQKALQMQMAEKAKEGTLKSVNGSGDGGAAQPKKRRRWDQQGGEETPAKKKSAGSWEQADPTTPSHGSVFTHFLYFLFFWIRKIVSLNWCRKLLALL